jgi:hypothetical protein
VNSTGDQDIGWQDLDEATVRQYLLDELEPNVRERLEERLMTDDELFAQLLTLEDEQEDELIDQYVHGQLSENTRERFERIFLSTPERQEKLDLVRDLKAHAASTAVHSQKKQRDKKKKWTGFTSFLAFFQFQNPLVGFSLAVALLLAAGCSYWLFSRVSRLESEVSQLRAERQVPPPTAPTPDQGLRDELVRLRARNDELEAGLRQSDEERGKLNRELAELKSQNRGANTSPVRTAPTTPQTPVLSLVLPLIRSRSTESAQYEELNLSTGAARVRLLLDLDLFDPADYKNYRAAIKRRDGAVVWRDNSPGIDRSGGQSRIVVSPPARLLNAGEYLVELSGIPESGSRVIVGIYTFRVVKK